MDDWPRAGPPNLVASIYNTDAAAELRSIAATHLYAPWALVVQLVGSNRDITDVGKVLLRAMFTAAEAHNRKVYTKPYSFVSHRAAMQPLDADKVWWRIVYEFFSSALGVGPSTHSFKVEFIKNTLKHFIHLGDNNEFDAKIWPEVVVKLNKIIRKGQLAPYDPPRT